MKRDIINIKTYSISLYKEGLNINIVTNQVIELVCNEFDINFLDIVSKEKKSDRSDHKALARQIMCYMLYVYCSKKPKEISYIVNRDRTTMYYSIDSINSLNKTNNHIGFIYKENIELKIREFVGLISLKELKEQQSKNKESIVLKNVLNLLQKRRSILENLKPNVFHTRAQIETKIKLINSLTAEVLKIDY